MRIGNEDLFVNYTVKDWDDHENEQINGQSLEYYFKHIRLVNHGVIRSTKKDVISRWAK